MLAAIIGDGPVGRYIAERLRKDRPETCVIGLRRTRPWLRDLFPNARIENALAFLRIRAELSRSGTRTVVFAGNAGGSLGTPDRLAIALMVRRSFLLRMSPTFWYPHTYLWTITDLLESIGISVADALDFAPELRAQTDLRLASTPGYEPDRDFSAAVAHARRVSANNPRASRQAYIVDNGKVLMPEESNTDGLIRKFGSSKLRSEAHFPVLCRVSTQPFGLIDPPIIGAQTVRECQRNGVRAILIEAGRTIMMQTNELDDLACQSSVAIYSVRKEVLEDAAEPSGLRA